jgi:predicted XRE-type DNA-binding protein
LELARKRFQDNGSGKTAAMTERRTRGSGNVFLDVGFPPDEAQNLLSRAQLMSRIRDVARGTTQREAAKQFGVSHPRLNDLLRGKIGKFSLDALVNILGHVGMRVALRVRKAA